jgi:hypothetical protein
VLIFNSRQGVELNAEELEAVRDDIGNVLHIAKVVDDKAKAYKPDHTATAKFVEETKKKRAEALERRDEERRAEAERQRNLSVAVQAAAAAPAPKKELHATKRHGDLEHKDKDKI